MTLILCGIAIALGLACVGIFRWADSIPSAAGAGAPGSILILISGVAGLSSIFCLGVALGTALPHS
jgi:hypothetical protein